MKPSFTFQLIPVFMTVMMQSNIILTAATRHSGSARTKNLHLRGVRHSMTANPDVDAEAKNESRSLKKSTTRSTDLGDSGVQSAPSLAGTDTVGTKKTRTTKTDKSSDNSGIDGMESSPVFATESIGQINVIPGKDDTQENSEGTAGGGDNDSLGEEKNDWVEDFSDGPKDAAPEIDFSKCTEGLFHYQKVDENTGEIVLDYYLNAVTGRCVVVHTACPSSIYPADRIDYSSCAPGCLLPGSPNPC